jgi:hypothetical protein
MQSIKTITLSILFLMFSVFSLKAQQSPPFETIISFFEAFHQKDSIELSSFFDPQARVLFTSNDADGQPQKRSLSVEEFVIRVCDREAKPVWDERLGIPEVIKHQNLATIWVPFEFYLDTEFSHSGYNFFQLFWNGEGWKIILIADTRE